MALRPVTNMAPQPHHPIKAAKMTLILSVRKRWDQTTVLQLIWDISWEICPGTSWEVLRIEMKGQRAWWNTLVVSVPGWLSGILESLRAAWRVWRDLKDLVTCSSLSKSKQGKRLGRNVLIHGISYLVFLVIKYSENQFKGDSVYSGSQFQITVLHGWSHSLNQSFRQLLTVDSQLGSTQQSLLVLSELSSLHEVKDPSPENGATYF